MLLFLYIVTCFSERWIYLQYVPVILQRIEEESKTNKYLVKIQQVKELEEKTKTIEDMQRVVSEPLLGQTEIDELDNKVSKIFSPFMNCVAVFVFSVMILGLTEDDNQVWM